MEGKSLHGVPPNTAAGFLQQTNFKLEPAVSNLMHFYERLAHRRYKKHCSVFKLNPQVLAHILKLLGTDDRLNVRLTCKFFKESIDNHVGLHINFDDRLINLHERSMPPAGASSLYLWSVNQSKPLDYVLQKPDLITRVTFGGQISLSCYTKIASRCKNVEIISFTERSHLYANIIPMRMASLKILDLGCPGIPLDYIGIEAKLPLLWLTYESLLKRLIAPNLRIFRIFFCCSEDCSILHQAIAQIFRFLAVHDKVTDISVNLHHRYEKFNFMANEASYRRFRIDVPKKVLRQLQFEKIHVEALAPAFQVWDHILPGQKSLTTLDVVNNRRRWFYFTKIITNNYSTLKVVRLHNIAPNTCKASSFDCTVFQNCHLLETLFLSRFINSTQEVIYCYPNDKTEYPFLDVEASTKPEVVNLTNLPLSLRHVHLQGFVLSTSDMHLGFSRLKHLQTLEIQLSGYHLPAFQDINPANNLAYMKNSVGLGVTPYFICGLVFSCRKLEALFLEEFENEWTKVRDTKLGAALQKLSSLPGDGFIDDGGYYGILIADNAPIKMNRLTRSERMHSWNVRISQYSPQTESKLVDNLQPANFYEEGIFRTSKNCLLEIIDKEKGQLDQIHRLLHATDTPLPITPSKERAENTKRIAKNHSKTLFTAIPNYHKASRLLVDTRDKFASCYPRCKLAVHGAST